MNPASANDHVPTASSAKDAVGWHLHATDFDAATARHFEGLFTQGSGYLHVRGSLEEPVAGAPQNTDPLRGPANVSAEHFTPSPVKWGTFVPGVFAEHPLLGHELVNLPFFLGWTLQVGEEVFDITASTVEAHARALDLRDGMLRRTVRWQTHAGAVLDIAFARFVSAARPFACCQRLELRADREVDVTVTSFLDADVRTNGFDHFTHVDCGTEDGPTGLCRLTTNGGDVVEMRSLFLGGGEDGERQTSARRVELVARVGLRGDGEPRLLEKRTVVATSRDLRPSSSAELMKRIATLSWERLADEHRRVWEDRWRRAEVEVDGDPASRRALRASQYHLLRSHVPDDLRVAIDAKGAAGEAYYGRFFWDTEMFLLPFFLYTDPEKARTLVDFRVHTLEGARDNARAGSFAGARYAWESSTTGREQCKAWPYAEQEVHVTADVVYGCAHYARAVDPDYLLGTAADAIVETARFWLDRIDHGAEGGADGNEVPHLRDVLGPDEYTPSCTDNAFTNRMVRFALEVAAKVGKYGGAHGDERSRFKAVARALPLLRNKSGKLILQCAEQHRLKKVDLAEVWPDRTRPLASQVPLEELYRMRVLKQADVLMMMVLFPDDFDDAEVRAAWKYYEPITSHDSSLSAGIHCLVASRLGLRDAAWRYWGMGRDIDLDPARGGAAEGIHIANAGATWMTAVLGFAGLRTAMWTEVFELTPRLPAAWGRLAFPLVWKGTPVEVELTRAATSVTNRGPRPLEVIVAGASRTVAPGGTESFPVDGAVATPLGAVLFDLDGVLVSTDHLHFCAWSALAVAEGLPFDWETNHRLRGVSRRASLDVILEGATRSFDEEQKQAMLARKNELYVESLATLGPADVLPGARERLAELRAAGIAIAVVSASRNAPAIMERVGLTAHVDELVHGGDTMHGKPDPEGFLLAARRLGVDPLACLVIEDAPAGLEAAHRAGMAYLAVGDRRRHPDAPHVVTALDEVTVADLRAMVGTPATAPLRAAGGQDPMRSSTASPTR